jgi:hypothetical protein
VSLLARSVIFSLLTCSVTNYVSSLSVQSPQAFRFVRSNINKGQLPTDFQIAALYNPPISLSMSLHDINERSC